MVITKVNTTISIWLVNFYAFNTKNLGEPRMITFPAPYSPSPSISANKFSRFLLLLRHHRRNPRLASRPLAARRLRHLLRRASQRAHPPRSAPHNLLPRDPPHGRQPHHHWAGRAEPLALHGPRRLRRGPVRRDHDLHHGGERLPARLLPWPLGRGQRLGGHWADLGGVHGDVYPAAVGAGDWGGEGVGDSGGYYICGERYCCVSAGLRAADSAVAGGEGAG